MRNIWKIIRSDAKRITASVVGIVFVMGLCLIPCLYAWFNVFSNWDPYGQSATSRMRVAVVSLDRGAEVLGLEVNLGETIIGALESNKQIGWVFAESREEALWRVYSGDCYAAVLIPSGFSRDFVSFLNLRFEHPTLQYYENGKKNAIAPKITGQAKTSVQKQVNATVLTTLVSGASEAVLALEANGVDVQDALHKLSESMVDLDEKLRQANGALDNVINIAASVQSLLMASSTLVGDISMTITYSELLAQNAAWGVISLDENIQELIAQMNLSMQRAASNFEVYYAELSAALSDPQHYNEFVNGRRAVGSAALQVAQGYANDARSLANGAGLTIIGNLFGQLSNYFGEMQSDLDSLSEIDPADTDQWRSVQETLNRLLTRSAEVNKILAEASQKVAEALSTRVDETLGTFNSAVKTVADLLDVLRVQTSGAAGGLAGAAGSVAQLQSNLIGTENTINTIREKLYEIGDFLDVLAESAFLEELLDLLREGPDVLDSYVTSPVRISEEILYPVDSYGSQMAPFYTVLSQWVAALFCAVLLKTRIREEDKPEHLKMPEHFFGRYALFFCICVAQALITSLGNLYYVGILCQHPLCYVLAAVMTGICFSMINYMLSFTLGAAGLAISVIVMVLQVGGSGGTYPVQVLPQEFQVLYPFMPYRFAMNAMREAVSGFYGNYYLYNIGMLALITLGCVVLGFILYLPGKWINGLLENAKAKSGIMI